MHGIKTIERLNAEAREADAIMAQHTGQEARAPYGDTKPGRDILFVVFDGESLLTPTSYRGFTWLATNYPNHPHDGMAVVLRDPDEISVALSNAEAAGLRVN